MRDLLQALARERACAHEAVRALGRSEGEPGEKADARRDQRRLHGLQALGQVLRFLLDPRVVAFCPDVREMGLHGGLQDLFGALLDLEAGRAPDLLRTSGKVKGASPVEAAFKGRVAAMVELLRRAGDPLPEAARRVGETLAKAGFAVPRGGRDGAARITARTVLQWHKEARNGTKHPGTALAYDRVVAGATTRALSRVMLRKLAASIGAGLHVDRDPTENLRVR